MKSTGLINIIEIDFKQWEFEAKYNLAGSGVNDVISMYDNLLNLSQISGKEFYLAERSFYGIIINNELVAATGILQLSEKCYRLRGFFTNKKYRGQGLQEKLLRAVISLNKYKNKSILSFSTIQLKNLHEKIGLNQVLDFEAVDIEAYNQKEKCFYKTSSSPLVLYKKNATNT